MTRTPKPPLVAICGRPNVGKSTLFNRITGRPRAIVHYQEGITRDRFINTAEWAGRPFRLVDTGGIVERPDDPVVRKTQDQVRAALHEARVILFVVDGREELTRVDYEIRDDLFTLGKPVVLAVNKLDNPALEQHYTDFFVLGLGEPYAVSATHGLGIGPLLDAVVAHLPEPAAPPAEAGPEITKVAVIGKPNVGKSSFVNALLNEERTIVDERPGTTRDAIDIEFQWNDRHYLLIDTAGLRRKAGIRTPVEHFSVSRALRSINRADVCLLLVDAIEGLTDQDKHILHYVCERGTGIVLVWTKWDLVADKTLRRRELAADLEHKAAFITFMPALSISTVTRQRLFKTLEYVDRVAERAKFRIGTGELNRLFQRLGENKLPARSKGQNAKVLYATQAGVKPTTFVLFVNQKRLFQTSYLRFLENNIRKEYDFEGVPIHIELREEKRKTGRS